MTPCEHCDGVGIVTCTEKKCGDGCSLGEGNSHAGVGTYPYKSYRINCVCGQVKSETSTLVVYRGGEYRMLQVIDWEWADRVAPV